MMLVIPYHVPVLLIIIVLLAALRRALRRAVWFLKEPVGITVIHVRSWQEAMVVRECPGDWVHSGEDRERTGNVSVSNVFCHAGTTAAVLTGLLARDAFA